MSVRRLADRLRGPTAMYGHWIAGALALMSIGCAVALLWRA